MDVAPFQFLLMWAVLAGSGFSGAVGAWRCGLRVGFLCAVATAVLLAAAMLPLWLAFAGCGFRLT